MRLYEVVVDDGRDVFKSVCCAASKRELKSVYGGNGEFLKVTDVTSDYPIDLDKVENALSKGEFGRNEIMLIKEIVTRGLEK